MFFWINQEDSHWMNNHKPKHPRCTFEKIVDSFQYPVKISQNSHFSGSMMVNSPFSHRFSTIFHWIFDTRPTWIWPWARWARWFTTTRRPVVLGAHQIWGCYGKQQKTIENGPVEIVDVPINSMVIFMVHIYIYWLVVWNMNFMTFPTDELIFFKGVETTNQIITWISMIGCIAIMGLISYQS